LEASDDIASFIGEQELLHGKIETLGQKMEHYKKLSLADIAAVAPLLDSKNLYMYWVE
jgi:hypothetical protein